MFFGTPHLGSSTASIGSRFLQLGSFFTRTNIALIQQLEKDSNFLDLQMMQFRPICTEFESSFFYEAFKTPISHRGWPSILVSKMDHPGNISLQNIDEL